MDELTLGLIGIGILVIVMVIIYNNRQGVKMRRQSPKSSIEQEVDVSLTDPHSMEQLSLDDLLESQQHRIEPELSKQESFEEHFVLDGHDKTAKSALDLSMVDERIDCLVPITLNAAISGEKILAVAQRFRRAGSKPILVDGRMEDHQEWLLLQPHLRYEQLRVSVQLANRTGALNEVEFSEFITGVQQFADALDGYPDFPEMRETVSKARELDQFAMRCDIELRICVLSNDSPWSANYIQSIATQDRLVLSRDGMRFSRLDEDHQPIFSLQFANTNFLRDDLAHKDGNLITLSLDVPMVSEERKPFYQLCEYAQSLANRLGGHVVDEQLNILSENALASIESQLHKIYATLQAATIPAGSLVTRRLFDQS